MSQFLFKGQLLILNYHLLSTETGSSNLYTIHPDVFREQMQLIKDQKITVLNLSNFLVDDADLAFAIAINFNDGNESDFTVAKPILETFDFDASFFVLTNALNKPGKLSLQQLKELANSGFHIGSHGKRHEMLTRMDLNGQRSELLESKQILEKELNCEIKDFAFTYGQYDEPVLTEATLCGYERCYSTGMRINDCTELPQVLFRWNITNKISLIHFEQVVSAQGKLSPAFDLHTKLIFGKSDQKWI